MRSCCWSVALLLALIGSSHALMLGTKPSNKLGSSPQADAATVIFAKKFPFDRPRPARSSYLKLGMFVQDVDGSPIFRKYDKPRRLSDISESKARGTFAEIAQNYGEEAALQMVKAMPLCLGFNVNNIKPALDNFAEILGLEAAQAMVQRNPGLLAVRPADAAKVNEQTMVFSYLVGITRPVGGLLLGLLFAALLSLPVEAATGISFRSEILALFGQ